MEKIMSVEDRIKRAEEIYARRHEKEYKNETTLYSRKKGKRDIKLLKKLIIQMIICLFLYFCVYIIQHGNYIFSKDFVNKTKEVLSYDINFEELYNNSIEWFKTTFKGEEKAKDEQTEEKNIGGSNEKDEQQEVKEDKKEKEQEKEDKKEDKKGDQVTELSEEEKQINEIKKTTSFIKPIEGEISSKYGQRNPTTDTVPKNHTGTDIAANTGTKIKSSTDGEVVISSSEGDYGQHLKIQVGEVSVIYAHCSKLYVKQGDKVKQGQEIAEVGSTGNSTGPHLHFEIRYKEQTVDPEKILEL